MRGPIFRRLASRSALALIPLVTLTFISGCKSIRSTLLYRDASNTSWESEESNGYPITLRVPTHIKVEIFEKMYLVDDTTVKPAVDEHNNLFREWDFQTQILETDKVFTVDYKRPAAGTLDYNTNYSPDQSIELIQNKLADDAITQIGVAISNTIRTITEGGAAQETVALTGVTSVASFPAPTGQDAKPARPAAIANTADDITASSSTMLPITNVVAAQVFALDAPDFESELQAFLAAHLGNAQGVHFNY